MPILWTVSTNHVPLLIKRLEEKGMVIHPREVLGDLADYKPDNREWRLSHIGHRIATTAALVASVAVIGGVCWLLADQWLGVIVGCFVGCNLAVLLMGLLQSSSDN